MPPARGLPCRQTYTGNSSSSAAVLASREARCGAGARPPNAVSWAARAPWSLGLLATRHAGEEAPGAALVEAAVEAQAGLGASAESRSSSTARGRRTSGTTPVAQAVGDGGVEVGAVPSWTSMSISTGPTCRSRPASGGLEPLHQHDAVVGDVRPAHVQQRRPARPVRSLIRWLAASTPSKRRPRRKP